MSPWRPRLVGAGALLAGLVTGACLIERPGTIHAAPVGPPDPWTASHLVPVHLLDLEGVASIELTAGGERRELWRQGTGVDGFGLPLGAFHVVDPPPGSAGWRVEGRLYPGAICIEPAPGGGLRATAWLDLEDYVEGVVAAEVVLWSAPPALLEAQAIAARSYAVASLDDRARFGRPSLEDGVGDQAYRGTYLPDAAARSRGVDRRLREAVERTRGQVLTFGSEVVDARFHGACGGSTASFADVFGQPAAPAQFSRPCPPCSADARAIELAEAATSSAELPPRLAGLRWSYTCSATELAALAAATGAGTRVLSIDAIDTDGTGRWTGVTLAGDRARVDLDTVGLRRAIGWTKVKSGRVSSLWPRPGQPIRAGLAFRGFGSGHGVGLCQRGARTLADEGWSSRRILNHYYAGAAIGSLATLDRLLR